MSEDELPEEDADQDELVAAFAALGGPLTADEFVRLLGSDEYYGVVVQLAALLLDGDTAAARDVARDSLAAVRAAWDRLGDPEKARVYLYQAVMNRARSARRRRATDSRDTAQAVPGAPGTGLAGHGSPDRDPWICALRGLPPRQREAIVLRHDLGLSQEQAAQAMGISIGAVRSHLARGMSSLQRPPRPG